MTKTGRYSDKEILEALRLAHPPDWAVRQLYIDCFDMAGSYVLKNSGTPQDAEDIFQDAVVSFIEMVEDGRFRAESSISSFLYSQTRHRWLNELRRRGRAQRRERDFVQGPSTAADAANGINQRELNGQVMQLIDTLGEVCRKILLAFYYENLPIREILSRVDYQNEQVLRNKKTKCMKELVGILAANDQLLQYFKEAINHE